MILSISLYDEMQCICHEFVIYYNLNIVLIPIFKESRPTKDQLSKIPSTHLLCSPMMSKKSLSSFKG